MMHPLLVVGLIALLSIFSEVFGAPQRGTLFAGQSMPLTRRMQPSRNASEWAGYAKNLRDNTIAKYSSQRNLRRGMGENLCAGLSVFIALKCDTNPCKEWLTRGWTQGLPRLPLLFRLTHFFQLLRIHCCRYTTLPVRCDFGHWFLVRRQVTQRTSLTLCLEIYGLPHPRANLHAQERATLTLQNPPLSKI